MRSVRFLVAALSLAFMSGCLFGPHMYGSRGFVYPGNPQYEDYLANCRSMSDMLDDACTRYGHPAVIQIGLSGGNFVWRDPPVMYRVAMLGHTTVANRVPSRLQTLAGITTDSKSHDGPAPVVHRNPIEVVIDFSASTHKGVAHVSYPEGSYDAARSKAIDSITRLAREQGVALGSGNRPDNGLFLLGDQHPVGPGKFDIEFTTL